MKGIGLILLGLAVGWLAASFLGQDSDLPEPLPSQTDEPASGQAATLRADIDLRLVAIERQIAELESEVDALSERIVSEEAEQQELSAPVSDGGFAEVIAALQSSSQLQDERRRRIAEAGFTQDRIDWLDRRVEELTMEARQAQAQAAVSGDAIDSDRLAALALEPASLLRPEIGDAEYERYLQAKGWPTTVGVSRVLASSPAVSIRVEFAATP